jgi:hypothetical protein
MTTKKKPKAAARKAARKAIVIDLRIDLNIRNRHDVHVATSNVLKAASLGAFSEAERNYYLALIEIRWRAVERDAQVKALEARISTLENRPASST